MRAPDYISEDDKQNLLSETDPSSSQLESGV